MKKFALFLAMAFAGVTATTNAQEVTYVEDPSQGLLINKAPNNWFIQLEGGADLFMSPDDTKAKFSKRIAPSFSLSVGKWISPVFGLRLNMTAIQAKGVADGRVDVCDDMALRPDLDYADEAGYISQKAWIFGPKLDAMLNLTNWWCGYKADRVYNAIAYVGFGVDFPFAKGGNSAKWATPSNKPGYPTYNVPADAKWEHTQSKAIEGHVGLLNKFAVSKRIDILLDIRYDYIQEHFDGRGFTRIGNLNALAGIGINLGKTTWSAPITAVCPTWKYTDAEGDALAARLQAAEAKIADLEKQLNDCLNRKPVVKEIKEEGPLATVYFPIGKTNLTGVNGKIVNAVANVMKGTDKEYVLTGWADNYTGNDKINTRLRKGRVATVKNALVKKGVEESRLDAQINDGNLTNFGAKCASLDRAVTIEEKK